jgi:hypothetical protein
MDTVTNKVETAVESSEETSKVETSAQLTQEEIAELLEMKKSKTHFQSIADSKISEANKKALEEQVRREMLERELESLKNPKPVERQLVKPIKPVKPSDFDDIEALTRGTSSYNYMRAKEDYADQMVDYQEALLIKQQEAITTRFKSLDELTEQEKKKVETAQFENNFVAGLQTQGMDELSAREAYKFFTSKESGDPKILAQIWKTIKTTPTKETYTAPPSPSSTGGGAKPNPNEYTKSNDTSWMYKTK